MVLRYARLSDHCHGSFLCITWGKHTCRTVPTARAWKCQVEPKGTECVGAKRFEKRAREAYLAYKSDYLIHIKVCFDTYQGMYEYLVVYNPALRLERRA
jgi:hypothetical protein